MNLRVLLFSCVLPGQTDAGPEVAIKFETLLTLSPNNRRLIVLSIAMAVLTTFYFGSHLRSPKDIGAGGFGLRL